MFISALGGASACLVDLLCASRHVSRLFFALTFFFISTPSSRAQHCVAATDPAVFVNQPAMKRARSLAVNLGKDAR